MDKFIYSLSILAIVAAVYSLFVERPNFMSQCLSDGSSHTECEIMWAEKNRTEDF